MTCTALADIPATLSELAILLWATSAGWQPEADRARRTLAALGVDITLRLDVGPAAHWQPGLLAAAQEAEGREATRPSESSHLVQTAQPSN
jgi:hypothetical protein